MCANLLKPVTHKSFAGSTFTFLLFFCIMTKVSFKWNKIIRFRKGKNFLEDEVKRFMDAATSWLPPGLKRQPEEEINPTIKSAEH